MRAQIILKQVYKTCLLNLKGLLLIKNRRRVNSSEEFIPSRCDNFSQNLMGNSQDVVVSTDASNHSKINIETIDQCVNPSFSKDTILKCPSI